MKNSGRRKGKSEHLEKDSLSRHRFADVEDDDSAHNLTWVETEFMQMHSEGRQSRCDWAGDIHGVELEHDVNFAFASGRRTQQRQPQIIQMMSLESA